tara:strand:- start:2126 stop:2407 length:282 start_codon:yes stop_codon:yes gene_type:complete
MNMKVDEFYEMFPKHFWLKMDGFNDLENMRQRQEWERCRWQTAYLLNPHTGKGKTIKPTDLIEFEWDKTKSEVDFEKLKERAEYIKKLDNHGE